MKTDSDLYLQEVYEKLEFQIGAGFFSLSDSDNRINLGQIGWIDQVRKLEGADAIYFVGDYPAVLFFKLDNLLENNSKEYEEKIHNLFIKVWNISRVPIFFVALPFEIRIYSAYQKPIQDLNEWQAEDRWLGRVKDIAQLLTELKEFSRSEVESGRVFQIKKKNFHSEDRVDKWLLQNLRQLRQKLIGNDYQKREYVHALIGRSIFIRYLEDRGVLVSDYFNINPEQKYSHYWDVLNSKEDTYRLFGKLREDFNGDLFPLSIAEKDWVSQADLDLLGDFLNGRNIGEAPDLLFWAYQFNIIPIELISNIYEEFYYENGGEKDKGTHYTPTTLVDFVLSKCLTPNRIDKGARTLDLACGSGVFLVEAFKRMVYRECQRREIDVKELPLKELTRLLTEQIVGIDINKSAVQVAAFSLYLAFLDFRNPPDIHKNKKLPKLIYDPQQPASGRSLFCANTFYPTRSEQEKLPGKPLLPFDNVQFDVIIGNPPWGQAVGENGQTVIDWCKAFDYPVGDREFSQCFIWRAQHLLKPGGEIGLLVSTGILFKHGEKSKEFRQKWLSTNQVNALYNFAHVRQVFFRKQKKDAISPFAAVFFAPASPEKVEQNQVTYIAVKKSIFVEQLQAVVIDKTDLHKISQTELRLKDWLWKTYIWGNVSDVELIEELKSSNKVLGDLISDSGFGYQEGGEPKIYSSRDLGVANELTDTSVLDQGGAFSFQLRPLEPKSLYRLGNIEMYKGPRILVKRGISSSKGRSGQILARLAYDPFAFRHSINGFRLDKLEKEKHLILLAIMRSSLAKYYHFLTCSTWGFWHDEIHIEEHLSLPVRFPENAKLQKRILNAVQQITTHGGSPNLFNPNTPSLQAMQTELDDSIFDLYDLSEPQRDLVSELCQITLEFYYHGADSQAVKPPTVERLETYRDSFLKTWIERLEQKGAELETKIYAPHHGLLCGMAFELKEKGAALHQPTVTDNAEWQHWFRQLSTTLRRELTEGIYVDRAVKEVNESGMFLIKRAESRYWTKSQARQDAHELLTEVFKLEWRR